MLKYIKESFRTNSVLYSLLIINNNDSANNPKNLNHHNRFPLKNKSNNNKSKSTHNQEHSPRSEQEQ